MIKERNSKTSDTYGNITFGEATELLVDIIGQTVILNFIHEDEQEAYKQMLERIYDGKGTFSKFATAFPGSPQSYFEQFFKKILENKYKVSPIAMVLVDSFLWQIFFALTCTTPFEKPKKETALFLVRKQIFNFIYDYLINGKPFDDGSVYKISDDLILLYLTDSYDQIFSEIEDDFIKNKNIFIGEYKNFWNEKSKDYPKIKKSVSLKKVSEELMNDGGFFYNELKESYEVDIEDLKNEKPNLYKLLHINKEDIHFTKVFKDAIDEFINNDPDTLKIIIEENPKSKIKYPYYYDYIKSEKMTFNFDEDIQHWREGKVYNPQWRILEPVLDFLGENNRINFVHRLIGLYLRRNAQEAMENILHISETEQEEIITDIKIMISEEKAPNEFYYENDFEFIKQVDLIYMCLIYQHQENFDIKKSDKIIKIIEDNCPQSKIFFSTWLNARAMVFEKGEILRNEQDVLEKIINKYREAYDGGITYAGCYLRQFLLEAIIINSYSRKIKDTNDFHGYGYALELFEQDKRYLLDYIKESKNIELCNNFIDIHYSFNLRAIGIFKFFPGLHSQHEINKKAIEINNKGLEFEKEGVFKLAIECFSEAITLNPVYVNAYSNRGNVYSKMDDNFNECALDDFNITLLLDPKHENTLFNRGMFLLGKCKFEKAIVDFSELLKINHNDSDTHSKRGFCYLKLKKIDHALEDFNEAIEINPCNTEAYNYMGIIYKLLTNS